MRRTALAALLLLLGATGCSVTGSSRIEAPVAVYVSLPLTGPRGADGRDAADGARLALEEARGRAGSLAAQAHFLDDARGRAWDPVTVGANARTAVQDHTTAAYIGELDSEPTRNSAPITNQAGIVQVSPGAGAVDLTAPAAGYPDSPDRYRPSGDVSFARTVPSDELVVDAAATWASELGVTSAAVTSDGTPFENLAASEFKSAAAEHGVAVSAGKPQGAVAVAPEGTERAVYEPATSRLRIYGKRAQALQLSPQLDPKLLPDKQFDTRFAQRFHRNPGPSAAYGYEAMALVLQGIREAGTDASSFRDDVRTAVIGAHRDDTVLGSYSITSEGDTTECMIQRYRIDRAGTIAAGTGGPSAEVLVPLGAPCPTR
ncbi:MAG TPA: ABC transporter substrate-binding protein [Solirubrobacterales bacterium]|nr:ABC transporter substrate-binding protein [Solirubrobacterales bacterium]